MPRSRLSSTGEHQQLLVLPEEMKRVRTESNILPCAHISPRRFPIPLLVAVSTRLPPGSGNERCGLTTLLCQVEPIRLIIITSSYLRICVLERPNWRRIGLLRTWQGPWGGGGSFRCRISFIVEECSIVCMMTHTKPR